MDNVLSIPYYEIGEGYDLFGENVEQIGQITYYPICMLMFLQKSDLPDELLYDELLRPASLKR